MIVNNNNNIKCFAAPDELVLCRTSLVSSEQPVLCMILKHHSGAKHDPQPPAVPHLMSGGLCGLHNAAVHDPGA